MEADIVRTDPVDGVTRVKDLTTAALTEIAVVSSKVEGTHVPRDPPDRRPERYCEIPVASSASRWSAKNAHRITLWSRSVNTSA